MSKRISFTSVLNQKHKPIPPSSHASTLADLMQQYQSNPHQDFNLKLDHHSIQQSTKYSNHQADETFDDWIAKQAQSNKQNTHYPQIKKKIAPQLLKYTNKDQLKFSKNIKQSKSKKPINMNQLCQMFNQKLLNESTEPIWRCNDKKQIHIDKPHQPDHRYPNSNKQSNTPSTTNPKTKFSMIKHQFKNQNKYQNNQQSKYQKHQNKLQNKYQKIDQYKSKQIQNKKNVENDIPKNNSIKDNKIEYKFNQERQKVQLADDEQLLIQQQIQNNSKINMLKKQIGQYLKLKQQFKNKNQDIILSNHHQPQSYNSKHSENIGYSFANQFQDQQVLQNCLQHDVKNSTEISKNDNKIECQQQDDDEVVNMRNFKKYVEISTSKIMKIESIEFNKQNNYKNQLELYLPNTNQIQSTNPNGKSVNYSSQINSLFNKFTDCLNTNKYQEPQIIQKHEQKQQTIIDQQNFQQSITNVYDDQNVKYLRSQIQNPAILSSFKQSTQDNIQHEDNNIQKFNQNLQNLVENNKVNQDRQIQQIRQQTCKQIEFEQKQVIQPILIQQKYSKQEENIQNIEKLQQKQQSSQLNISQINLSIKKQESLVHPTPILKQDQKVVQEVIINKQQLQEPIKNIYQKTNDQISVKLEQNIQQYQLEKFPKIQDEQIMHQETVNIKLLQSISQSKNKPQQIKQNIIIDDIVKEQEQKQILQDPSKSMNQIPLAKISQETKSQIKIEKIELKEEEFKVMIEEDLSFEIKLDDKSISINQSFKRPQKIQNQPFFNKNLINSIKSPLNNLKKSVRNLENEIQFQFDLALQ